jgi:hypothetical protein
MNAPRVLISYSHDSPAHAAAVLALADDLRRHGIDARIDQYTPTPRLGWPQWMNDELREAAFVVCVCTATYRARFEQRAPAGEGLGASWEGMLATLSVYHHRARLGAFVPVLLPGATPADVPHPLSGQTRHTLPTPAATEALLRHLLQRPSAEMPALGPLPAFAAQNRLVVAGSSVDGTYDLVLARVWLSSAAVCARGAHARKKRRPTLAHGRWGPRPTEIEGLPPETSFGNHRMGRPWQLGHPPG